MNKSNKFRDAEMALENTSMAVSPGHYIGVGASAVGLDENLSIRRFFAEIRNVFLASRNRRWSSGNSFGPSFDRCLSR